MEDGDVRPGLPPERPAGPGRPVSRPAAPAWLARGLPLPSRATFGDPRAAPPGESSGPLPHEQVENSCAGQGGGAGRAPGARGPAAPRPPGRAHPPRPSPRPRRSPAASARAPPAPSARQRLPKVAGGPRGPAGGGPGGGLRRGSGRRPHLHPGPPPRGPQPCLPRSPSAALTRATPSARRGLGAAAASASSAPSASAGEGPRAGHGHPPGPLRAAGARGGGFARGGARGCGDVGRDSVSPQAAEGRGGGGRAGQRWHRERRRPRRLAAPTRPPAHLPRCPQARTPGEVPPGQTCRKPAPGPRISGRMGEVDTSLPEEFDFPKKSLFFSPREQGVVTALQPAVTVLLLCCLAPVAGLSEPVTPL